jgi:hypothetical protein
MRDTFDETKITVMVTDWIGQRGIQTQGLLFALDATDPLTPLLRHVREAAPRNTMEAPAKTPLLKSYYQFNEGETFRYWFCTTWQAKPTVGQAGFLTAQALARHQTVLSPRIADQGAAITGRIKVMAPWRYKRYIEPELEIFYAKRPRVIPSLFLFDEQIRKANRWVLTHQPPAIYDRSE